MFVYYVAFLIGVFCTHGKAATRIIWHTNQHLTGDLPYLSEDRDALERWVNLSTSSRDYAGQNPDHRRPELLQSLARMDDPRRYADLPGRLGDHGNDVLASPLLRAQLAAYQTELRNLKGQIDGLEEQPAPGEIPAIRA